MDSMLDVVASYWARNGKGTLVLSGYEWDRLYSEFNGIRRPFGGWGKTPGGGDLFMHIVSDGVAHAGGLMVVRGDK